MKQKTLQWLLAASLLVCTSAVWAQPVPAADSPVLLEISDINGDKQTVPITDGMTLYWPQALLQDNAGHQRAYAVLCDKDNVPQFQFPVSTSELSAIRFLNAPTATTPADISQWSVPTSSITYSDIYRSLTFIHSLSHARDNCAPMCQIVKNNMSMSG